MTSDRLEDLGSLEPGELLERLHALDAEQGRVEAELIAVVGALERTAAYRADGHASVRGLLRAEARWAEADIAHRQRAARLIADEPMVADGLASGAIGVAQVRALARARANPRCGHLLSQHLGLLLDHARTLPFDDFVRCVRRWEQLADADGAHRDAEATHAQRTAHIGVHDGVGHVRATGGALDVAELAEILQRYADGEFMADWDAVRAQRGDDAAAALLPRTDAQRRFDALVRIFRDAVSTPAGAQPPEPTVNIVMDAVTFETTLARMRLISLRPHGVPTLDDLPITAWRCETLGGTLVDPVEAIAAALHGHVRRVVFDSVGNVIDLGRRRRLFTGAAREAVRLQSNRCIWPGCTIATGRCQADHVDEWQRAGETRPDNGAPLCGRHNRLKSRGYRTWRGPEGRWHTARPDGTEIGPTAEPTAADPPVTPPTDTEAAAAVAQRAIILDRALLLAVRHHAALDG